MYFKNLLDIFTAVGTVGAVVVAMIAIYISNKNSKQEILIGKFEELYEIIQLLASYYATFKLLYGKVAELREGTNDKLQTRSQYFIIRDEYISKHDFDQIAKYLSRLDVLFTCYTKADLYKKASAYNQLLLSFFDFVYSAGNLHQAIHFSNGYPNENEFYKSVDDLKNEVKKLIKKIVD